jgi:hypothetical protein
MTLEDKIYSAIHREVYVNESDYVDGIQYAADETTKIADEFAIGFAVWCICNNDEDLAHSSYEELLEIYKKEKGL